MNSVDRLREEVLSNKVYSQAIEIEELKEYNARLLGENTRLKKHAAGEVTGTYQSEMFERIKRDETIKSLRTQLERSRKSAKKLAAGFRAFESMTEDRL